MKSWISTWRLALATTLVCLVCIVPSSARATDWSLWGGHWDADGLDQAYGVGLRVAFFPGNFQMELGATFYEDSDAKFMIDLAGTDGSVVNAETEVIPADIGVRYNFGASRLYLSAGGTYYFIDTDVADFDDEWGLYYRAGLQFPRFFVEVGYRDVLGSVHSTGYDFLPQGGAFSTPDPELQLSGVVLGVGWRF